MQTQPRLFRGQYRPWLKPAYLARKLSASLKQPRSPSPHASAGLSYKDSGVDIDAGAELVRRIQKLNPSIGGFSGLVPFGRFLAASSNVDLKESSI